MRRLCLSLFLICLAASAAAQTAPTREHLAPPGWEGSYHGLHYTPVLRIGDRVIVSGIPAIEGETDEEKIRWAFQQLQAHLETAGATLADVVELQSFHVARDHAEFRSAWSPVLKVHREFFSDHYPAWTAVGTTALFSEGAPMEIRAEAIIGSGARPRPTSPSRRQAKKLTSGHGTRAQHPRIDARDAGPAAAPPRPRAGSRRWSSRRRPARRARAPSHRLAPRMRRARCAGARRHRARIARDVARTRRSRSSHSGRPSAPASGRASSSAWS